MISLIKNIPFYGKLSIALGLITAVACAAVLGITLWSNAKFHVEVTQKINRDLARYIIDHQQPLFSADGTVNTKALKDTAMHTMMINPMVEVYLLDTNGTILGHALHTDDVVLNQVPLSPIQRFIEGEIKGPIYGPAPREPERQCIFSAAPIFTDGKLQGYLYVLLSSQSYSTVGNTVGTSYILGVTATATILLAIAFFAFLWLTISYITRPIKHITEETRAFFARTQEISTTEPLPHDELAALQRSFELMKQRITSQFHDMQRSEQMRRELVSNISHDLRTPLASIQGYIETLILKLDQLDDQQKREHLRVALKHSKRLGKLISALFELSKLESTSMKLERTQFSLTELVYDITQEFSLRAEQKNIRIAIDHPHSNLIIDADIGLLERVFQNLIDNALRHTPDNGQITIELKTQGDKVSVALADTGSGIAEDELPYIFERYYRANNTTRDATNSSGLGLAIVKRILELHGSSIAVYSKLNEGAKFSFPLKLSL